MQTQSSEATESAADLTLENVSKKYGDFAAVDDISLSVARGEFVTFLGPSGCGKTSTLRMVAGFEGVTLGRILIQGNDSTRQPAHKRNVNTVFQNYALFPHLSVFDNIAFGLQLKNTSKSDVDDKVGNIMERMHLHMPSNRRPHELSGGQQQRVALARALVNSPAILLLDEPLGALDLKLRQTMQLELKQLQQTLGITFVFVTHDQEEAMVLSDRIVVMNAGKIAQVGTPSQLYREPRTRFVADFIGKCNSMKGRVVDQDGDKVVTDLVGFGRVPAKCFEKLEAGSSIVATIRPEFLRISASKPEDQSVPMGHLEYMIDLGPVTEVFVRLSDGTRVQCDLYSDRNDVGMLTAGDPVWLSSIRDGFLAYPSNQRP